ncbi:MAG: undecaprenyl-diphosphatase [Nocardioidaceae bacterium]|nr:undecaprenyl-diphosphatase [Nocardioidaceae bacterium]
MDFLQALVLGVVEGLTEFLPVSSTGHLTIAEKLLGLSISDKTVTGFTAVIQMGAIAAVIVYFWRDIWRIAGAWFRGVARADARGTFDYRMGWYVIVGSIPVAVVGLLGRHLVTGPLRNLWWVGGALIAWSVVMVAAERMGRQDRHEHDLTMRDALIIGVVQCISLIPGVSRSGATISAGLFTGLDRVAATRMSFFLSIPALLAAGLFELPSALGGDISLATTLVATVVSFVVAYAAVAWLLQFVAHHPITWFVGYRVALGVVVLALLATGALGAT